MTQANASEQLSAYLDGELSEAELAELESQLEQDPALRAELEQLERAVTFLRTHGPVQAPPHFRDKVLEAVANEPMPGRWVRWLRRPFGLPVEGLAVALAAAVVLLVALPLGLHTSGDDVKDLAGDPYGFVRGEEHAAPGKLAEPSPAPTRDQVAATDSQTEGAAGGESANAAATGEADAAVDGEKLAKKSAPVSSSIRPTPRPASTAPPPPPVAAEPAADGVADVGPGLADATPSDVAQAQAPMPVGGAVYAYRILTYDAEALAKLQRIAARYKGKVLDSRGRAVTGELQPDETYSVELPSGALAAFGDDLRSLGMVTELPDEARYVGSVVRVQVTFDLVRDKAQRDYAPSESIDATSE